MERRLILDADGVLFSEQPYWEAALAAALATAELDVVATQVWDRLIATAFGPIKLQCTTKALGCNSNWDLAAVLVLTLQDPVVRSRLAQSLIEQQGDEAAVVLHNAVTRFLTARLEDAAADPSMDPLRSVGIDRDGEFYATVKIQCERALNKEVIDSVDGDLTRLLEDRALVRDTLESCRRRGFALSICTGRPRTQIVAALESNELIDLIRPKDVTSSSEVLATQAALGRSGLGKPHWYSPARAAFGERVARAMLEDPSVVPSSGELIYVGDGYSDYKAIVNARRLGLPMTYVHVRSGVTSPGQDQQIAAEPFCLAVVDRFSEVGAVLERAKTS